LYLGDLASGQRKVLHLKNKPQTNTNTNTNINTSITLNGQMWLNKYEEGEIPERFEIIVSSALEDICLADLTKYIYRQRTQEMLFISRNSITKSKDEKNNVKTRLKLLQDKLIAYRDELIEDEIETRRFVTNLCDDIYITHKALCKNHNVANMYITTRQRSQGRQESYNCSDIEGECKDTDSGVNIHSTRLLLTRQLTQTTSSSTDNTEYGLNEYAYTEDIEDTDEKIEEKYTFSQNILTPYATKTVIGLMRSVSGNSSL